MPRIFLALMVCAATALAPRSSHACNEPTSTSISTADDSLDDWMEDNLCMWQGTDASLDQARAGADILGFAVTHASAADVPNHFWFIRLRGAPLTGYIYRLEFVQEGGHTVLMDMTCPGTGDPQTCTLSCTLDGQAALCAASTIRAYSLANGEWAIELTRQSTQLFFDATDNSTITASSMTSRGTVRDTSTSITDYQSNEYATATAVLLARFSTHQAPEGGVEIHWETGAELGTLGFFVRRGGPEGPRLNAEPVPGQLTSPVGDRYSVRDPLGTPATTYYLEELSTQGDRFYGPAAWSPQPAPRPLATLSFAPTATLTEPGRPHLVELAEAFAEVQSEGIYRISRAAFTRAGLRSFGSFELGFDGAPIPTFLTPEGEVLFYASAPDSPERPFDSYRLARNSPPLQGRVVRTLPAPAKAVASSFQSTVHAEEHHLTDAAAKAPLRFPWGYSYSGAAPKDFSLELPDYLGGPVLLTLNLVGMSVFEQELTHHALIQVNGQAAVDATFGGTGPVSYSVTIPDGVMHAGTNAVPLGAVADLGVAYDLIGLNSIDATYSRGYVAADDALSFTARSTRTVQVGGFSAEPVLFDVTDPAAPVRVTGLAVLTGPEGVAIRFRPQRFSASARRYYAAVPKQPRLRRSLAGKVPGGSGDYVAIVGDGLSEALEPLLAQRRADGRSVVSVGVEALYDKFGHGQHGPQAIRSYLAQLDPPPRDVLLVGKPSIDPHDYLGAGVPDLLPTQIVLTADLEVYSASDALLVAGPDGRTPFAAIGRLPVLTPQELEAWVTKLLRYERTRGEPSGKALFAADDTDSASGQSDPLFRQASEALAARLAPMEPLKVYLPDQSKPQLLAAMAQGPDLVTYHGHGGGTFWAPRLLSAADLPSLPAARPFFLVTVDCWDGMFAMPTVKPLSQQLAQAPQGGAIAAFAAASLVDRANDALVDLAVFPHLADPTVTTAGELARRAQTSLAGLVGPAASLVFVYNLIGDPATPLPHR